MFSIPTTESAVGLGYVYFIDNGDHFYKIGSTGNPEQRLAQLQTASRNKLHMLAIDHGGSREEARLHEKFSDVRAYGEWFFASGQLRAYIQGLIRRQLEAVLAVAERGGVAGPTVHDYLSRPYVGRDEERIPLREWNHIAWREAADDIYNPVPEDIGHRMSRLILERGVRFTDEIFSALSVVSA